VAPPTVPRWLAAANLALLVLYPLSWFAPLLRAGIDLPLFGTEAISVASGLRTLWTSDVFLALVVTVLAVVCPFLKTIGLSLVHFRRTGRSALPALEFLGRLAMADIFLVALYVVVSKGVAMTRVETGWGLYLFTFCVLSSLAIAALTRRRIESHRV
jgi:paraquat-inducible protein A